MSSNHNHGNNSTHTAASHNPTHNATTHNPKAIDPNERKPRAINESLRLNLTKEMFQEVQDVFNATADEHMLMAQSRLPLALKALGMSLNDIDESKSANQHEELDLDQVSRRILSSTLTDNYYFETNYRSLLPRTIKSNF